MWIIASASDLSAGPAARCRSHFGESAGLAFPRRLIWMSDPKNSFRNPWIYLRAGTG